MKLRSHAWQLALLGAVVAPVMAAASPPAVSNASRWAWLKNTVWYVPPVSLPALVSTASPRGVVPVHDQTVYAIGGYAHGYYWGVTRVQIWAPKGSGKVPPDSPPTCLRMVGSVTPEGSVNVSFTPMGSSGERTTGRGTMTFKDGEWTMELQMTSGDTAQLTHWAYMKACPATGRCMLPGVSATAQRFILPCKK